ncbi:hypothetical protein OC842_003957 [Tilletia horrida]|uniref:DNA repair metallo-beta-lactamase domain-containing protein n=1 Tax=Tilletia horrida TaxID=155126 RepID=A0AAN6JKN3_9BASI|nr:hypothetical protein OC842_003957 [Tilletia horrida]
MDHGPTHSGFLAEYPLIRVDMHLDDKPPLPFHVVERLRSGRDATLDAAIGDLHPTQTHFRHAEINLLTHLHSDHLMGLADKKKWPDVVICSVATKEMLLRLETQKHRIAMDVDQADPNPPYGHLRITKKEAQAARKTQGSAVQPRDVLRALSLNTPTTIRYTQTTTLTITLIDANHMPGAVMFLIEGPRGAVLHTGDVRAEPWWVEKLRREPVLQRYIAWDEPGDSQEWATSLLESGVDTAEEPLQSTLPPPGSFQASASKQNGLSAPLLPSSSAASSQASACPPPESTSTVLENIYIDTECLFFTKPALSKTEAVREIVKLIAQFPPTTPVFINCFTWGYEELLIGICRAFGQKIHVDKYKRMMYSQLGPDHLRPSVRDAGTKMSIGAESHPFLQQALTLQEDGTRFHACERQNMCGWLRQFQISEPANRAASKVAEPTPPHKRPRREQTPRHGSPATEPSQEVSTPLSSGEPKEQSSSLPSPAKKPMTESQVDARRTVHMREIRAKDKLPDLSSPPQSSSARASAAATGKRKASAAMGSQTILHLNPTEISAPAWRKYLGVMQLEIDAAKRGEKPWPRYLFVPFPRHSPLPELQGLTALFRPRTITPNTVSKRLGGWVYYILPRLFRSHLHRQNSSQLENECRGILGAKNWTRARQKEQELFALHTSVMAEKKKRRRERTESSIISTASGSGSMTSASKSSISVPPPGQGRRDANVGTTESQSSSDSDSKISHLLASSGKASDEALESSLMLLRLIDHYLFKQPPVLLQTMVGDKEELHRHLSDLRRLALQGSADEDEEDAIEEVESEFLKSAAAEVDEEGTSQGEPDFELLSARSRAAPSTANYDADISGAPPRRLPAPQLRASIDAKGHTAESGTADGDSWSIIVPRPGPVRLKVTQRGYDADADDDDADDGEDSRSTIRQGQTQSQPRKVEQHEKPALLADLDHGAEAPHSQSLGVSRELTPSRERSPSLGAPISSPLWAPPEPGGSEAAEEIQETQAPEIPSSPIPRMRLSMGMGGMSSSMEESQDSRMHPSSPTSNLRALRAATIREGEGAASPPAIRVSGPESPTGGGEDPSHGPAASHRPSTAEDAQGGEEDEALQHLLHILPTLETELPGGEAIHTRLVAYEWLRQGPPLRFPASATQLNRQAIDGQDDARWTLLAHILYDIHSTLPALENVQTALLDEEADGTTAMRALQVSLAAIRFLGDLLAGHALALDTVPESLREALCDLVDVLPHVLRSGPVLLALIKQIASPLSSSPWPIVRPTVLASAGLLHLVLELVNESLNAHASISARSIEGARCCLDAFGEMTDVAAQRQRALLAVTHARVDGLDEGAPAKRRKTVSSSAVPETSFYVPPSSSNEASQMAQDAEENALSLFIPARNARLPDPMSPDLRADPLDAATGVSQRSQGGVSVDSAPVSSSAVEQLSRQFRTETREQMSSAAILGVVLGPRPSLWGHRHDHDRGSGSPRAAGPSHLLGLVGRRSHGRGRKDSPEAELEPSPGEKQGKKAIGLGSSQAAAQATDASDGPPPAAVSIGVAGLSLDVSDTQWGAPVLSDEVEAQAARMVDIQQRAGPKWSHTNLYARERGGRHE